MSFRVERSGIEESVPLGFSQGYYGFFDFGLTSYAQNDT